MEQTSVNDFDHSLFKSLYEEGLKNSSKKFDETLPLPKFYSKVRPRFSYGVLRT